MEEVAARVAILARGDLQGPWSDRRTGEAVDWDSPWRRENGESEAAPDGAGRR